MMASKKGIITFLGGRVPIGRHPSTDNSSSGRGGVSYSDPSSMMAFF